MRGCGRDVGPRGGADRARRRGSRRSGRPHSRSRSRRGRNSGGGSHRSRRRRGVTSSLGRRSFAPEEVVAFGEFPYPVGVRLVHARRGRPDPDTEALTEFEALRVGDPQLARQVVDPHLLRHDVLPPTPSRSAWNRERLGAATIRLQGRNQILCGAWPYVPAERTPQPVRCHGPLEADPIGCADPCSPAGQRASRLQSITYEGDPDESVDRTGTPAADAGAAPRGACGSYDTLPPSVAAPGALVATSVPADPAAAPVHSSRETVGPPSAGLQTCSPVSESRTHSPSAQSTFP